MLGLDVIEVMTPSGHPSIINKIKRSSVCGLKFGGGVVFSQICSVASGAFKELYTLLVSKSLPFYVQESVSLALLVIVFFFFCLFISLNKYLLISTILCHCLSCRNSSNTAKPKKQIKTHNYLLNIFF
jgi:hypothetical protein